MNFGIPDKDQVQIKKAFSLLWDSFGNIWDNVIDDKKEEKIKTLEKEIMIMKRHRNLKELGGKVDE
jgi:divalent metal cation (Fe/Co/Zn/Cd) transporter|tara:strand:+ start:1068 stop:1265 length:198 start_codon:yes stop_codon:yes gene_type:complete